jgi:hypothetical protein
MERGIPRLPRRMVASKRQGRNPANVQALLHMMSLTNLLHLLCFLHVPLTPTLLQCSICIPNLNSSEEAIFKVQNFQSSSSSFFFPLPKLVSFLLDII